jgi:catechol 2,3-dioxygenase-like lactoylglutathione lyase family enzyme
MIKARKLRHATFATPDLQRAVEYYTHVLGLVAVASDRSAASLATGVGDVALHLKVGPEANCTGLTFEVAPDEELATMGRQLDALGLKSEECVDPVPGISRSLCFHDPKGTLIELVRPSQPLARREPFAGVGPLKLGHVAFFTPEPAATAEFYETILGFRVSDWLEDFFVFMRCDADHHSVNFLRGEPARMHHCAFELKDAGHIRDSCDVLAQAKIPLVYGPVRFGPGHNLAVFHRTPDGQLVEFFAELDQIKDEKLGYFEPRPWHRDRPQRPKTWTLDEDPIWGPPPPPGFL